MKTTPTDNNTDQSDSSKTTENMSKSRKRRRLVNSVVATSGLAIGSISASQWIKPVVSSVVIPAHAITSLRRFDVDVNIVLASAMDFFISNATAAPLPPCPLPSTFCADITGSSQVDIKLLDKNSGPISFTNGVSFGPVNFLNATNGNIVADYTLNPVTISGSTISGSIGCNNANPSKTDSMATFAGILVPGTCSVI